jgi:beta-phosphoglucomutase
MNTTIQAFIFDLDGVLVDTARFHYKAWRRLANSLGFDISLADNERLKGVSRLESLEIILSIGGISSSLKEKQELAIQKNNWYIEYLSELNSEDILNNADFFVKASRFLGIKTALASASKNAHNILKKLEIDWMFDAIIDGTITEKAKPDPEVFLKAARGLNIAATNCVVFEDSLAGLQAARNAQMACVGIGSPNQLSIADMVISGFIGMSPEGICMQIQNIQSLLAR